MKRLLIGVLVLLGCVLPSRSEFATNTTELIINIDKTRSFRDGRFKWNGYEDQSVIITLKTDTSYIDTSLYDWNWKASRRVAGTSNMVYILKTTSDIKDGFGTASSNITFGVSKADIPPNGNYQWELLALTSWGSAVRSCGQGKLEIIDSLYDDDDSTFSNPSISNLTDYLTIAAHTATTNVLDITKFLTTTTHTNILTKSRFVTEANHIGATGHTTLTGDIKTSGLLKLTGEANPTTASEGEIDWDSDDGLIEIYHASASYAVPLIISETVTILQPDLVQPVSDKVLLKHFDATGFPGGATITAITITTDIATTNTVVLEEWSQNGSAWTEESTTETMPLTGVGTTDSSLTDGAMAAGNYLFLDFDATTTDMAYMNVSFFYYVNDND